MPPSHPESESAAPEPEPFFGVVGEDGFEVVKAADQLTPAERQTFQDDIAAELATARTELSSAVDHPNTPATVEYALRKKVEGLERREAALAAAATAPAARQPEPVAGEGWTAEGFERQLAALEEQFRTHVAAAAQLEGEPRELELQAAKKAKWQRLELIEAVPAVHLRAANAIRERLGVLLQGPPPPTENQP